MVLKKLLLFVKITYYNMNKLRKKDLRYHIRIMKETYVGVKTVIIVRY